MNNLLLFVNSAAQNGSSNNELMPLLMTKLAIGLAIFGMLIIISKMSNASMKKQQTQS